MNTVDSGGGPRLRSWARSLSWCLLLVSLGAARPVAAATVPTGYQQYHVVGHEQHVFNFMQSVWTVEGGAPAAPFEMRSVVSAVASADSQIIYYDQWEDGFDAGLVETFPTFPNPQQASTLVFGDANQANGRVCDFSTDPRVLPCNAGNPNADRMFEGTPVNLDSDGGLAPGCTAGMRCSVPMPRNAADVRFDGGDFLVSSGGPLSMIHNQDPNLVIIGGATEMMPRQAVENAFSYTIPIGEDLCVNNACDNTVFEPFKYVYVDLVAYENNTQIFINSPVVNNPGPTGGTVSITLNRGQHYSSQGLIDMAAAAAVVINSGTKISTTKPISAMTFTAGTGTFATDFFAVLPDLLHGTDYMIPSVGDDAAVNGNRPKNLYIFNPDPTNTIAVTATDTAGSRTFNVLPSSAANYFSGAAPNRFVPANSTVRLTSTRAFWGVGIHDHQGVISDWGYSWLPRRFLTSTYTSSFAPGRRDPAANPPPSCTPVPCNTTNRAPLWVAATLDNTRVQIDFNNDDVFDVIDTNGDDQPDAAPLPNNTYVVNALGALRVYDYTDYDNTGTRITANKPISVAYGQDTDQGENSDNTPDTGYVVFPLTQLFLDPVLTLDKVANPVTVPGTGGPVVYTVSVQSYTFGPLTNVTVFDDLPAGVLGTAYAAGSTLITYPDLTQSNVDPAITTVAGRTRLTWTLTPDTLDTNSTLTIRYTVNLPAGPSGLLTNEAHATGLLGASRFEPLDTADVVRTNVTLSKTAADNAGGAPGTGSTLTFTLSVRNQGAAETNVAISDAIPVDTTFVPGSITNAGPFTGTYSVAQNAVVWSAANFAASSGPFTLSFQVTVNPGVPAGTIIRNQAGYESTQTPYFPSNETQQVLVGPALDISKSGSPTPLHPGQQGTFTISVKNTGTGPASLVEVLDSYPANTTYVAGSMEWQLNSGSFVSLSDAADADEGEAQATRIRFLLATLGPGQDFKLRFRVLVNALTNGQFVNNQATVGATQVVPARDTNLVQIPIVGNATVTGHVFFDADRDGTQDPDEPNLANVTVSVRDTTGVIQTVVTDAFGNYSAVVPVFTAGDPFAQVQLNPDQTDPDVPPGSTLTTANDPQNVTPVANATTGSTPVGYGPVAGTPLISLAKTSNAPNHQVYPGLVVTYTVTLTNYDTATQTGITINDPLPAGTSFVNGSTQVLAPTTNRALRVTEYYLGTAAPNLRCGAGTAFTATTCNLNLAQALQPNYFVLIQGANDNTGDSGPDDNYVALTADGLPGGTGDLGSSGSTTQITLTRGANPNTWVGVVTVVECLGDCTRNGFRLLDVRRPALGTGTAGTAAPSGTSINWTDITRVVPFGGANGSGCNTGDGTVLNHRNCHVRLNPSGANTVNWTRDNTAGALVAATPTVMVVEWGSEWDVQRGVIAGGAAGADGANTGAAYNTAAINPVTRYRTWVWGTGHTNDDGVGDSAEGVLLTLGPGFGTQAQTENAVAAGIEFGGNAMNFDIYTMSHPNLQVDYRFLTDGNAGGGAAQTLAQASDPTVANTMAVVTNGGNATTNDYSQTLFSARYLNTTSSIQLERRRSGIAFPAWLQGITADNLRQYATTAGSNLTSPTPLVAPADGFQVPFGHTLTVTYQVRIDDPLAAGITQVVNTATVSTAQNPTPRNASVTDDVIRFGVTIEPNNARFGLAGGFLLYTHDVVNTGTVPDSYTLTHTTELGAAGWTVQLLDPDTGAVLANDLNGDGVWDGGVVINTGTLAPGGTKSYRVRVNIPGTAVPGVEQTVNLIATSNRNPLVRGTATDETTVLDASDFGPVAILPDNSGVVTAGNYTVYAHRVINNTLLNDTFDLTANSTSVGWQSRFYYDSNSDGIYTPGIDIQINNTANLPPGGQQLIFVRVDAPPGATANTVDVTHLTARSRNDTNLFDGATDTTTVVSATSHDLSGGATRLVQADEIAVHQGTLINQTSSLGRFDFEITQSSLFGLDGFAHPTELWIEVAGTMTLIATDTTGDGTWDNIVGGFGGPNDQDNDQLPDVQVPGNGTLAYELRRQIPTNPTIAREFVTLTAVSWGTSEEDNVTATDIVAAVTRASIRAVHVDAAQGLVEFVTGGERRTLGFELYATSDPYGGAGWRKLTPRPVLSSVRDSVLPTRYRVEVGPLSEAYVWIVELETTGARLFKGPYLVADAQRERAFEKLAAELDARASARLARLARRAVPATEVVMKTQRAPGQQKGIRVEVQTPGIVTLSLQQLQAAGYPGSSLSGIAVTVQGQPVALLPMRGETLGFRAEALDTDFTGTNVYLITWTPISTHPRVQLTRSEAPPSAGSTRVAHNSIYLASAPTDVDPWFWGLIFSSSGVWPPAGDPTPGQFDLPGLVSGGGNVAVRLHLFGYSEHQHLVSATLNGVSLGSVDFKGQTEATLSASLPLSALLEAGNQLELAYSASGGDGDGYVYLDWLDLDAPRAPVNQPAGGVVLSAYAPDLPALKGWDYLIVTHADFLPEAQRLAALKSAAGLQALVLDVQQAYDHYSSGAVEGRAVKRLIADVAKKSLGLRHVLLLGDDTFDTHDYVGSGARSFVPSLLAHDGEFGRVPSDNLYADLDGDHAPELSIGRLPVQTLAEATVVVDKIQNQDASLAAYNGRHLLVVDNDLDTDAPFRAEADTVPPTLPEASVVTFADLANGLPHTRAALETAWGQGQMAMHYFGHGGPAQWADEPLLTVADVGSFATLPTVLFTWGCETQWYQSLDGPALNERLLLEPGGGVLASFGPVGVTSPAAQQSLYKAVYPRLFAGQALGEALRDAKRAVLAEHGESVRRAVEGFNFFGDPALVLPMPPPKPPLSE